jgi:hypothetical protein
LLHSSSLAVTATSFSSPSPCFDKKASGLASATDTGIGVYGQIQEYSSTLMIQDFVPTFASILKAEAHALLVAASFASALNLQHHSFPTDNSIIASAAASGSTSIQQAWEKRRHIAQYNKLSESSQHRSITSKGRLTKYLIIVHIRLLEHLQRADPFSCPNLSDSVHLGRTSGQKNMDISLR